MADGSGRMLAIDAGMMQSPACCAVCGSTSNEDGYVDPQIFIEYHGSIYFCYNCVIEMAMFFSMASGSELVDALAVQEELREQILVLNSKLAKSDGLLDSIRNLNNFFGDIADPAVVALLDNVDVT
jgi:hypothetical protein